MSRALPADRPGRKPGRAAAWPALLLFSWGLVACQAERPPRSFTVGAHRISARAPAGWETLDRGREVLFRKGDAQVALRDLGPVGPHGIHRELERACELWRSGRERDARWRMRLVPVPPERFGTPAQRDAFWAAWHEVAGTPEGSGFAAVEVAFDRLLESVDSLKTLDVAELSPLALGDVDDQQRREVAARRPASVDGRDTVVLDTWDRMSHERRSRVALILDDGYLLALASLILVGGSLGDVFGDHKQHRRRIPE